MKAFVVLTVLAVVAIVASEYTKDEKKAFKDWRKQHKKQYKTHAEEMAAMDKFMKNFKEIEEHNKQYDDGKHTFHRRVWEYSDLSKDEKRKLLHGVKLNDEGRTTRAASQKTFPVGPKSVDWRKKGLVGPVLQQGGCGACWTFSVSAIVEAAIRKKNRNKAEMSKQQLLDCVGTGNNGCGGGDPRFALNYVKDNGQTDEDEYPYAGYQRTCEYTSAEKIATISEANTIMTNGNETQLRDIVASVGPVSIVICLEDSFHNYGGGVYNPSSCCTEIQHAVAIVGYGTDPVGGDYWIVKNSWGTSWGENGYIRMARNRGNLCNVAFWAVVS
jgi:cathepsin L